MREKSYVEAHLGRTKLTQKFQRLWNCSIPRLKQTNTFSLSNKIRSVSRDLIAEHLKKIQPNFKAY